MGTKTRNKTKSAKAPQLRLRVKPQLINDVEAYADSLGMTTNSYIISLIARDMALGPTDDVRQLTDAIGKMADLIKTIGGYKHWNESKESRAAVTSGIVQILDAGKIDTPDLKRLRSTLASLLNPETRSAIEKVAAHHG